MASMNVLPLPSPILSCCECGRGGFVHRQSLKAHISRIHLGWFPFQCLQCNTKCCTENELAFHFSAHHPGTTHMITRKYKAFDPRKSQLKRLVAESELNSQAKMNQLFTNTIKPKQAIQTRPESQSSLPLNPILNEYPVPKVNIQHNNPVSVQVGKESSNVVTDSWPQVQQSQAAEILTNILINEQMLKAEVKMETETEKDNEDEERRFSECILASSSPLQPPSEGKEDSGNVPESPPNLSPAVAEAVVAVSEPKMHKRKATDLNALVDRIREWAAAGQSKQPSSPVQSEATAVAAPKRRRRSCNALCRESGHCPHRSMPQLLCELCEIRMRANVIPFHVWDKHVGKTFFCSHCSYACGYSMRSTINKHLARCNDGRAVLVDRKEQLRQQFHDAMKTCFPGRKTVGRMD